MHASGAEAKPRISTDGRASHQPAIDDKILGELTSLGGQEFLTSLVAEFSADTDVLMTDLRRSVAQADALEFRNEMHALQSAAANIGAKAIHQLCVEWRRTTSAELLKEGVARIERLTIELERAQQALLEYCSRSAHST